MNAAAGRLARRDTDGNVAGELAPTTTSDRLQPRMSARRRNTNLIAVTACGAPRRRLRAPEPAVRIATGLKARLMLGHAPRACRAKAIRLVCKGLGTHVVKG